MKSWLSIGGLVAACAVGGAAAVGLGVSGLVLLFAFFVPASLLTPGGGRRRAIQVGANGGVAAVAALLALPIGARGGAALAFAGALAAAAADTWATEIGGRSRRAPRLITTGQPVAAGTSGGVTALGWLGAAGGGAVVAASAALLRLATPWGAAAVLAGALAGAAADSVLGATLQDRYRCPVCDEPGEQRRHRCGAVARLTGGVAWITNDTVNLAATLVGAVVAVLPALVGVPLQP